jgi:4'-phosphopantetheinyl transferase
MNRDLVDVWLIWSDPPGHTLADLSAVLDDAERRRAEALAVDAHRRRFTAAHGAARLIIGHYLGLPPEQVRWRHGPHGKPEVDEASGGAAARAGARISLSHSGDLAMLAVTRGRRVGVDVQQFPAGGYAVRMAERYYPPAEARFVAAGPPAERVRRFVALWTRKEACVKVTGGRLMQGMKLPVCGHRRVLVHDPGGPLPGPYLVRDLPAPPGFSAAVALDGAETYRVSRHVWPSALGSVARGSVARGSVA